MFKERIPEIVDIDGIPHMRKRGSGRCRIYGLFEVRADATDPFANRFMLLDTWGAAAVHWEVCPGP